jgi:hypothetical protein
MAKLLEKFMATKLQEYGEKTRAILPSQMGCRSKRSTIDALAAVYYRISDNLKTRGPNAKEMRTLGALVDI